MSRQPQHQNQESDFKQNVNIAIGIAHCIIKPFEAWLRIPGSCGSRYFSGQAFLGWTILLFVATFMRSQSLMEFWIATGGVFLLHRIVHLSCKQKGYRPHSRFVGISFFSFLGGNRLAYRFWEPLLTCLVGYALARNGDYYGNYVCVVGVCLWISSSYTEMAEQAQITALHDARAEQLWLAERMRSGE